MKKTSVIMTGLLLVVLLNLTGCMDILNQPSSATVPQAESGMVSVRLQLGAAGTRTILP